MREKKKEKKNVIKSADALISDYEKKNKIK